MSKIFAISSAGKTEKSFLDLRFGKCENVVTYNAETGETTIIENPYKNEAHSGINLVKFLINKGVSTIITGEVGAHFIIRVGFVFKHKF
ncbi:MAG: hypothetical protein HN778_05520 [Prolixibacteraceae bacterium]|jgi:predicted Fe-Mo cluster-binding NifX family protein|nr:hypothetical protein [Prolixibacteraceae bacterium]MBT6766564.1 hypothetical protein [Prolixibacteraceae bacterium]MBT6996873.1 hypothetical protein [Prolixibacteraceae bacterium]MBT7394276.1 hypothetical protein [Prolixibacteraceae bacterium]